MKKAVFLILIAVFCGGHTMVAQENLNEYKYIIVPKRYDFLKEADKYQLNSLTKFLFEKYGFTAIFIDSQYPDDLARDRCLALKSDVRSKNSMFKTKLTVELKNCRDEVVYTSREGTSREKQFNKAYNLALRDAFKSFEDMNYTYTPGNSIKLAEKKPVATVKTPEAKPKKEKVVQKVAKEKQAISKPAATTVTTTNNTLYAQALDSGYQVVDSTPKIVMILLKTSKKDVYIVKDGNAIVYKDNGAWYLSEMSGSEATKKQLNIKF